MKKFTHRLLPLALCFSLTLGAFAYRPSEAKAIAGVDDAVVIGALLSAFAGGCGLIFTNNGMTSGELAQGLTDKWNEFKAAVLEADTTFAGWLGYEDMDALLQAIVFSGGKALTVPRLVARKFADFTTWLTDNLGVTAGGEEKSFLEMPPYLSVNGYRLTYIDFPLSIKDYDRATSLPASFSNLVWYPLAYLGTSRESKLYPFGSDVGQCYVYYDTASSGAYCWYNFSNSSSALKVAERGTDGNFSNFKTVCAAFGYSSLGFWTILTNGDEYRVCYSSLDKSGTIDADKTPLAPYWGSLPSVANGLSVFAPSYYKNPTIDLPAEGEEAANPILSGVGDGSATSIEELLQKILEQLQANTLAPTLDVAGTETGGNTGTDEDAKPYLPYIPQIFEKIKELPGTLANIWESIKGIPAAIAEKIGAFFTALWGWLQNIIDAITALPAAIAEKVGELFKPDEVLLSEITDTFKGKFGFFSTLKQFGNDLFGMTPETEPPVIWVHLENAESKFGYNYGDKQKIFDMTWYQKYKASVDGLLSGFLWLGYLWLLFKRAPSILNGMQMDEDLRPPLLVGDVSSAPRLGAGDPSIHYGEGFTFRSKGGRRK